jgi:hypothetical protein
MLALSADTAQTHAVDGCEALDAITRLAPDAHAASGALFCTTP